MEGGGEVRQDARDGFRGKMQGLRSAVTAATALLPLPTGPLPADRQRGSHTRLLDEEQRSRLCEGVGRLHSFAWELEGDRVLRLIDHLE